MKQYLIGIGIGFTLLTAYTYAVYMKGRADAPRPHAQDTVTVVREVPVPGKPVYVIPKPAPVDPTYQARLDSIIRENERLKTLAQLADSLAQPYGGTVSDSIQVEDAMCKLHMSILTFPLDKTFAIEIDSAQFRFPERIITQTIEEERPWWEVPVIFATGLFAGATIGLVIGHAN